MWAKQAGCRRRLSPAVVRAACRERSINSVFEGTFGSVGRRHNYLMVSTRWRIGQRSETFGPLPRAAGSRPVAGAGPPQSGRLRVGLGGSGPAQLALALLLDHTGSPGLALEHYQHFKGRRAGRAESVQGLVAARAGAGRVAGPARGGAACLGCRPPATVRVAGPAAAGLAN